MCFLSAYTNIAEPYCFFSSSSVCAACGAALQCFQLYSAANHKIPIKRILCCIIIIFKIWPCFCLSCSVKFHTRSLRFLLLCLCSHFPDFCTLLCVFSSSAAEELPSQITSLRWSRKTLQKGEKTRHCCKPSFLERLHWRRIVTLKKDSIDSCLLVILDDWMHIREKGVTQNLRNHQSN